VTRTACRCRSCGGPGATCRRSYRRKEALSMCATDRTPCRKGGPGSHRHLQSMAVLRRPQEPRPRHQDTSPGGSYGTLGRGGGAARPPAGGTPLGVRLPGRASRREPRTVHRCIAYSESSDATSVPAAAHCSNARSRAGRSMWVADDVDAHAVDGGPEDDAFLDATMRGFVSQSVQRVRGSAAAAVAAGMRRCPPASLVVICRRLRSGPRADQQPAASSEACALPPAPTRRRTCRRST
jgi:hypothetical protein